MRISNLLLVCLLFVLPLAAHDPLTDRAQFANFEELIPAHVIQARLDEIAEQIDLTYVGEEIVLVSLLKGAICVTVDLMQCINTPSILECARTSSYGAGGKVRGELKIEGLDCLELTGKNVLVIDDIYDSGVTLESVVNKIRSYHPRSLRSFVLLMKNIPHKATYMPDWIGFEIEDRFVIGYGMDYKEYWRDLPSIYAVD